MHRFWHDVTRPLLDAAMPRRILEIGIGSGIQTRAVEEWASAHSACVVAIDPRPACDVPSIVRRHPGVMTWHEDLSLSILPSLPAVDVALVDGDHNWFTVFNECRLLFDAADREQCAPPILICHDVAWPYGRRDGYYNPDTVPAESRQPYSKAGMRPGSSELIAVGGVNASFCNAQREGGARNGTLTAIEDFLATRWEKIEVLILPLLHGLGILIPPARVAGSAALADLMDHFRSITFYDALIRLAERHRLDSVRMLETLVHRSETVARRPG